MKFAIPHVTTTLLFFGVASISFASPNDPPNYPHAIPHPAGGHVTSPAHVAWIAQAIALERQEEWQPLMQLGYQWTRAEPGNATAWFVFGRALTAMYRYPDAIEAYQRLLKIDPRDVYARNNLGDAYRETQRPLLAMHTYCDALRIDPDYMPAWQNLGMTFFKLRGMAGVSQALQKLRASDPELAEAWSNLLIGYSQTQDERIAQQAVKVLRALPKSRREQMFNILFSSVAPTIGSQHISCLT
ncbi:MAG: tetratricopeptide repeat protein [Thiobacillaceae bacterium]